MDTPARTPERLRVGVSISGGGFRASAWGIGTLLGILRARELDRGEHPTRDLRIASIASVSGGSITNGVVAQQFPDLNASDSDDFPTHLRELARMLADRGLFFFGRPTNRFLVPALGTVFVTVVLTLVTLGGLVGYHTNWDARPPIIWFAVISGGVTLLFRLVAEVRNLFAGVPLAIMRDVVFAVVAAVVGAVVGIGAALTRDDGPGSGTDLLIVLAVATAVLWLISIRLAARRGRVVEHALAKELFADVDGEPLPLAALEDRQVHHVFCATELQSGDYFYFSPRFAYGYQYGFTMHPGTWTLARAVQASAALPLGFPPQRSTLATYGITLNEPKWVPHPPAHPTPVERRRVVLADGGVYDNLGSEWDVGYDNRHDNIPALTSLQQTPNLLVVTNAGKALEWKTIWTPWRLWWEVAGLLREQSIQYDQTTAPRRSALIRWFQAGEQDLPRARRGVIVQASSSPYDLALDFTEDDDPDKARRAAAWIPVLEARRDQHAWQKLARSNANIPTVLRAIGRTATLDLIEHATVLTQLQLHVHYDIGSPAVPDRDAIAQALGIAEP